MNKVVSLFLFLIVLKVYGQDYRPVQGRLMTTWGEKVTPDNAWREYPRPQLKRNSWQNLNGMWEYAIVQKEQARPEHFQGNILVPFAVESALSGVGKPVLPDQKIWYRKNFEIPADWKGQQILLHFQAVDWETTVWVNGKLAGSHKGGSTAFSFDITRLLKKGEQELIVSVWDPTDTGDQARGKQVLDPRGIWYTPVSGIWQTVWMEPVGQTSITGLYPVSDIEKGTVTLQTNLSGAKGGEEIRVKVTDNGRLLLEKSFPASAEAVLNIPSPKLWSPESPALYQMEVSLYRKEKLLDKVDSYFALRKISMVKDEQGFQRIQLNNQTIFQYGTLDQGWWPDGLL
ncbi:MAG TPA: beta-galactosidase, partial [Prolixibacteraceae bacterium]|nr:beta-galactosidase [Prolixibacteraceae bacterium]